MRGASDIQADGPRRGSALGAIAEDQWRDICHEELALASCSHLLFRTISRAGEEEAGLRKCLPLSLLSWVHAHRIVQID